MTTLTVNPQRGLLEPLCYQPSPYCDERPQGVSIDMIVIHAISLPPGEFGSTAIEEFFCGKLDITSHLAYTAIAQLHVSAHLLIKRTGDIIQFVPFTRRAWHAGESFFCGKNHCNDFSVGIELEGVDDISYELIQYKRLIYVIHLLKQIYPAITHDRIVGHADVAPGRKTDPGPAFDWTLLNGMLT